MNIVAYCRVSTDKEDQLNSLETQKQFFQEYAERNNHNLIRVYADEGISGTKMKNRKQFLTMMRDSDNGTFEKVVTKDVSRMARNAVDFLTSIRQLKAKGITCDFVNANLTTQDGELVLGMMALVAQEESGNTSKRIKFSKRMNAEKGRVPNIVYGYDKVAGDYFNLTINEPEAEVVRRIYHMYLVEGLGQNRIAIRLNEEGLRTKRNCKWSQNAVARILSNEIYMGKVINGKQEVKDFLTGDRANKAPDEWMITDRPDLAIIDPAAYDGVQQLLNKRHNDFRITKERSSTKHIFSTLIKCAHCGHSFRRSVRRYKNTYVDWVCSGRNQNGAGTCPNRIVISEPELLQEIRNYLLSLLSDKPNVIKNVVREFNRIYESKDNNQVTEKTLLARIDKLKANREKYIDMNLNDVITMDELKQRTQQVNQELEQAENELQIIRYNLSKGDRLEHILYATFKDIESIVNMDNLTNVMLKRVIKKITVDASGKVDIYLNLFSEIGLNQNVLICNDCT